MIYELQIRIEDLKAQKIHSNGKLLLTGEYVVLDGALSLAVPTKYGQSLIVEPIEEDKLIWTSFDDKGEIWFKNEILIHEIANTQHVDDDVSKRLIQILNEAKQLNPNFINLNTGFKITTQLDFPRQWGLGTSSTLINNIAEWVNVDAYQLLENTFGGSGYDIACAQHNSPITYQLEKGKPIVNAVDFNPSFKANLYFVYLNKKQNSRDGIANYRANKDHSISSIKDINAITHHMISCDTLGYFGKLMEQHESIISKITKQTPVKNQLFTDFKGYIKSLGAWGGDFILVASEDDPRKYFEEKGFNTVLSYEDIVL